MQVQEGQKQSKLALGRAPELVQGPGPMVDVQVEQRQHSEEVGGIRLSRQTILIASEQCILSANGCRIAVT